MILQTGFANIGTELKNINGKLDGLVQRIECQKKQNQLPSLSARLGNHFQIDKQVNNLD
jgi:superfamily II helicase